MSFPRTLVATEYSADAYGGGPTVIRQLLKGVPSDRLAWWSCLPPPSRPQELTVGTCSWVGIPPKWYPYRKTPRLKSALLAQVWVPWAAFHLRHFLKRWNPEAIWLIPHQWSIPVFEQVFSQGPRGYHLSIQDYPDTLDRAERFGIQRVAGWAQAVDRLYREATTGDATSAPMAEDLARRTARIPDGVLHFGLETEDFVRCAGPQADPLGERIRLVHAGSINDFREFSFLVHCLQSIRGQLDRPLSLDFYGSHDYRSEPWFNAQWMQWQGDQSQAHLSRRMAGYDWGLCVMPMTDEQPRYSRYSFPTKFITYLAGGAAILAVGHPQSSLIKIARKYPVGICLDQGSESEVCAELSAGLRITSPRRQFQSGIMDCARTEFDAVRNRDYLARCLNRQVNVLQGESQ